MLPCQEQRLGKEGNFGPSPFQGMMETETCRRFMETETGISLLVDLETETCFRFHQSLVIVKKRSRQIGAGKSARGGQI